MQTTKKLYNTKGNKEEISYGRGVLEIKKKERKRKRACITVGYSIESPKEDFQKWKIKGEKEEEGKKEEKEV